MIIIAINIIQRISSNRERLIDERMEKIAYQASRITFLYVVLISFTVMIIDGIKQVSIPYSEFMSYFISSIVLIYLITYKTIEKRY